MMQYMRAALCCAIYVVYFLCDAIFAVPSPRCKSTPLLAQSSDPPTRNMVCKTHASAGCWL
eukprot:242-Pyramimonas_sp.AAC.1